MKNDIAKKVHEELIEHFRYQANSGEMFNIFDAMGVRSSELAWSAWIAFLLDPKRKHYCGDIFLKLFIRHLPKPIEFNTESACVHKEWVIELGRIDIIITDDANHAIIIENKIFASDQPEQIARYHRYAKEQCFQDFRLLYLTRFGSKPSKESTCGIEDFYCISYIDTIKRWLEECGPKCIYKPRVHDFIEQAREAINDLCRQTLIDDFARKLIEKSLNLNDKMIGFRISVLNEFGHSEYEDVNEQCIRLVKQYRKEQFDELITRYFNQSATIQPLEGVLDGYWSCKTFVDDDEIDNIFVMRDWEGHSLYCGIEFRRTFGHIYNALKKREVLYEDSNNANCLIWQVLGLDNFDELYEQLDKILNIVSKNQSIFSAGKLY